MEYKRLQELRNTYPTDPDNISKSFVSNDITITYTGKYEQNFITFEVINFNGINSSQLYVSDILDDTFGFIVQFNDDDSVEQWTSKKLKDDLESAIVEPNPYFNKLKVPIAIVDMTKLKKYWKSKKFDIPEKYAEVRITDTITTINDMLTHINWIVSTKPTDDELRSVSTFGAWSLYTGESGFGFQYSNDIDDLDNGKIVGDDIVTKDATEQFKPFGESGTNIGDIKVNNDKTYIWSGVGWVLK
jgi:hypothetical protein